MTSNTEKTTRTPLIHHPSDALDSFGRYDASSWTWRQYDLGISQQIADFENSHPEYRKPMAIDRRSGWSKKPR